VEAAKNVLKSGVRIRNGTFDFRSDILTIRQRYPVRVGFLSDLHCGDSRAIMTSKFINDDKQTIKPNEVQKILWRHYRRVANLFRELKTQYIWVPGDCFAGNNKKEVGAWIFLRLQEQIRLAADLLTYVWQICDKKPIFFVWRGTTYHELQKGLGDMHQTLVDLLRSRGIKALYLDQAAYIEFKTPQRTRRIFIAHEAPTALVYPATLMSRDINWALQAAATGQALSVDAIIRAHIHHWLHVDQYGIHAVQLPCWQAFHPYKSTVKYFFRLQPDIGGAFMLIDEKGRFTFWGGSYPFSPTKKEYQKLHIASMNIKTIKVNGATLTYPR